MARFHQENSRHLEPTTVFTQSFQCNNIFTNTNCHHITHQTFTLVSENLQALMCIWTMKLTYQL